MYAYEKRVSASQVGEDELLTLPAMAAMMQDCSLWWLESEPAFHKFLIDTNTAMMIGSRQIEVVRYPAYCEQLRVETSIYSSKPRLGFRNTFIYDASGAAVAKSWGVGVFVSLDSGQIVRVAQEIVDGMSIDEKLEMNYLPKKIQLPDARPQSHPALAVMRSDIDLYRHMNNVSYVRMACEYVPDGFKPHTMRVEYKAQAKLGDKIYPHVYQQAETTVVNLARQDATPYAIVEFS